MYPALLLCWQFPSLLGVINQVRLLINESMINDYSVSIKPFINTSYDYVTSNAMLNRPLFMNDLKAYVSNVATPSLQNVTLIRYHAPNTSVLYNTFIENFIHAVKQKKLLSYSDYLSFGKTELSKLTTNDEKKSAAFIIALGSAVCDYCHSNSENMRLAYNNIVNNKAQYLDSTTGLLKMNIYQTNHVVQWVLVALVVVTAVVLAFPAALPFIASLGGAFGTTAAGAAAATATAWGITAAAVISFGAGVGAYAGACPIFLNSDECRLGISQ